MAAGGRSTRVSDIYSVGLVLDWMFTGCFIPILITRWITRACNSSPSLRPSPTPLLRLLQDSMMDLEDCEQSKASSRTTSPARKTRKCISRSPTSYYAKRLRRLSPLLPSVQYSQPNSGGDVNRQTRSPDTATNKWVDPSRRKSDMSSSRQYSPSLTVRQ